MKVKVKQGVTKWVTQGVMRVKWNDEPALFRPAAAAKQRLKKRSSAPAASSPSSSSSASSSAAASPARPPPGRRCRPAPRWRRSPAAGDHPQVDSPGRRGSPCPPAASSATPSPSSPRPPVWRPSSCTVDYLRFEDFELQPRFDGSFHSSVVGKSKRKPKNAAVYYSDSEADFLDCCCRCCCYFDAPVRWASIEPSQFLPLLKWTLSFDEELLQDHQVEVLDR